MTPSSSISKPSIFLVLLAALALISAGFIANPPPAEALTLSQCNDTDNAGDEALECHYVVTNNLNGSATSSTVTLTECHGFKSDPATMVCTSSTTSSPDLVTSVEQCNGSGNLRSTVTCTVEVVNNITATVTATPATVNQCDGSGEGGGALPLNCSPYQTTTNATVTQCNGSGNGGGATQRVNCSVGSSSTTTSLLPVTVNQCNGSANGGGSYLVCSAQLTDVITAPAPSPSPSPSVSTSPSPVAPPPPNPPNPNPPPPNQPPPNQPPPNPPPSPSPSPSATPTPTASPTPGPTPEVTPTPSITPSPETILEPDETIAVDDGGAGGAGGGGGGGDATRDAGRAGGGEGLADLGGGRLRDHDTSLGTGTRQTGGATTTGQVTRVPTGGANTGGGSTSGIENTRLMLLGFMLLAAAWPTLAVRRRSGLR